jgi:hypothetical protein
MLFVEYLEEIGCPLDSNLMLKFFNWLAVYLSNPNGIRIIRTYKGHKSGRAYKSKDGLKFVGGSNEPAVWCFTELYHGRDFSLLKSEELIQQMCDCRDLGDGSTLYRFRSSNRKWETGDYAPFHHKHIFDVKGWRISRPPHQMTREMLDAQMIRYLCPMNHFLFPRKSQKHAERESDFQAVAAWYMREQFGEKFNEFLGMALAVNSDDLLKKGASVASSLVIAA